MKPFDLRRLKPSKVEALRPSTLQGLQALQASALEGLQALRPSTFEALEGLEALEAPLREGCSGAAPIFLIVWSDLAGELEKAGHKFKFC